MVFDDHLVNELFSSFAAHHHHHPAVMYAHQPHLVPISMVEPDAIVNGSGGAED